MSAGTGTGPFRSAYASALLDYLLEPSEASLRVAYELAREAVSRGFNVLELADAHQQALMSVLLDASAKRCAFLAEAIDELGYTGRVTVVRARAEDGGRREDLRGTFDLVVSRGFGPPPVTAECGAPFLQLGGTMVVSEPPAAPDGDPSSDAVAAGARWPDDGLARFGLRAERAWSDPFHYRSFVLEHPCPEEYPRRDGVPAKHPLF